MGLRGKLAVATLRGRSGGAGTTAATAASATLGGGTISACRYSNTILRCACGCLYLFATLVIALEVVTVVVEVVAAFENDGGFVLRLLCRGCGALSALGARRTLAAVTISVTAPSATSSTTSSYRRRAPPDTSARARGSTKR